MNTDALTWVLCEHGGFYEVVPAKWAPRGRIIASGSCDACNAALMLVARRP